MTIKAVCVFCGANRGRSSTFSKSAGELGRVLASRGYDLVFGGGSVGLMGATADAVLAAGGRAIGVIPENLMAREIGHKGLTQLHVVNSMHERKALMERLSDAFVALPGGFGTLEELCEILTWAQLGLHGKPLGLLNVAGFFDSFLRFLDHAVAEGFIQEEHRALVLVEDEPRKLFDRMADYQPPQIFRWIRHESQT